MMMMRTTTSSPVSISSTFSSRRRRRRRSRRSLASSSSSSSAAASYPQQHQQRRNITLKSAGDGIDGVISDDDKIIVRFWHHFGSSKKCAEKRSMSSSESSHLFRNPTLLEAKVRRLHAFLGYNVDIPMTVSNVPEILELDAELVCKRLMFLFKVIPEFNGSKVSKHASLLTLEKEEVERRVRAVVQLEEKKWVGGGVDVEYAKECAKERMVRNPSVLLLDSVTAQCNAEEKIVQHR
tara:strand:- start:7 stop:717 length:711 start_codon:yes stop_codon:yes gene_type:complete